MRNYPELLKKSSDRIKNRLLTDSELVEKQKKHH